jgi:hypothetical protein
MAILARTCVFELVLHRRAISLLPSEHWLAGRFGKAGWLSLGDFLGRTQDSPLPLALSTVIMVAELDEGRARVCCRGSPVPIFSIDFLRRDIAVGFLGFGQLRGWSLAARAAQANETVPDRDGTTRRRCQPEPCLKPVHMREV